MFSADMTIRVAIVGGGVAGLAAALELRRHADEGRDVSFALFERSPRLGGKILSERVDGHILDGGPDCFLTEKPAVHRLARRMGIEQELLSSDESRKRTMILAGGKLHDLPDGVMMMVPTRMLPFATTGLFTLRGKARMGLDLLIPRRRSGGDESLASFVTRRMGRECLDRLAEPLVGGLHASDPETMSLEATFPRLLEMERQHGSLIRGFVAARRRMANARREPAPAGARPRTFFTSFRGGMQQLTEATADAAGREWITTGVGVDALERTGSGWRLRLTNGTVEDADAVILATEAWAAAGLLEPLDGGVGEALAAIPHSSSATISLAFRSSDVRIDTNAFGFLCPQAAGRRLLAATYSSTKWPGRAPEDRFLIRVVMGGPHDQAILEQPDDSLVETARAELSAILGLDAEPQLARVYRWKRGMPQYTMGHIDRVAFVDRWLAEQAGLAIAGGSYRGVGVPNCIESGEAAVAKVVADRAAGLGR